MGNGDPAPGFATDFRPLTTEDLEVYLPRLSWLQADLLKLVRDIPPEQVLAKPEAGGRTIRAILLHVAEAH